MSIKKLKLTELGRVDVDTYKQQEKLPICVILDNLRSGLNVGAFFRTSDALGLERIILTGITPVPPHKEIHKSAIGATLSVDFSYDSEIVSAIKSLKESGYYIIGIEQTNTSTPLHSAEWPNQPIAIVFGNEVEGISEEVLPHLDASIEISQFGTKHSLNVAVCGGIVLWEASRHQRQR